MLALSRMNQAMPAISKTAKPLQAIDRSGFCRSCRQFGGNRTVARPEVPNNNKQPAICNPRAMASAAGKAAVVGTPYWATVKLKCPSVLWVSTDSACQLTLIFPGIAIFRGTINWFGCPGTDCGFPAASSMPIPSVTATLQKGTSSASVKVRMSALAPSVRCCRLAGLISPRRRARIPGSRYS